MPSRMFVTLNARLQPLDRGERYHYGPSGERTRELIADVLARFPLAQRCRVVSLDLTPPSRG
ncbi:hypothetical protein ODJ79_36060 [Actinoplanes sp. KI2]|uniref:hypothetical protein n=1 Tax=Actinoplanes sp. KI2 TaxID=2983315 RepID=UPI0021D5E91D|nr:hypothetical protein [Actinoplanes sp. KI2]MCU7729160.1 hypothetical protein [Actinoplanes sp. KI2]